MSIARSRARRALTPYLCLGLVLALGAAAAQASPPGAAGQSGKIPITTKSEAARADYLEGRDLAERLRVQESRAFFEKAVAADPDFALAWLGLSASQPSAKELFAKLGKAEALSAKCPTVSV